MLSIIFNFSESPFELLKINLFDSGEIVVVLIFPFEVKPVICPTSYLKRISLWFEGLVF